MRKVSNICNGTYQNLGNQRNPEANTRRKFSEILIKLDHMRVNFPVMKRAKLFFRELQTDNNLGKIYEREAEGVP